MTATPMRELMRIADAVERGELDRAAQIPVPWSADHPLERQCIALGLRLRRTGDSGDATRSMPGAAFAALANAIARDLETPPPLQ